MKTLARAAVLVLSLSALVGCDAILGTNLFSGLVEIDADDIRAADSLAEYQDLADSDSFFETLEDDGSLSAAVLADLEDIYTDAGSSPEDIQEAGALAGEIYMKTTPAGAVVDKLVDVLLGNPEALESAEDDPAAFIASIMPPSAIASEAAFRDTIQALLDSWDSYLEVGASIGPDEMADGDINAGEIAQYALVGALLTEIGTDSVLADADLATELWKVFKDPPEVPGVDLDDPMTDLFLAGSALSNILGAAGLSTADFGF